MLVTLAAVTPTLADPSAAEACACCADDGVRIENADVLRPDEKAELGRIRFATSATLYSGAGDLPDYAKGIKDASRASTR